MPSVPDQPVNECGAEQSRETHEEDRRTKDHAAVNVYDESECV
jgi:hypothetical protein